MLDYTSNNKFQKDINLQIMLSDENGKIQMNQNKIYRKGQIFGVK